MFRYTIASACAGITLLATIGAAGTAAAAPAAHSSAKAAHTMLGLINRDRRAAGLAPLTFSPSVARVALAHSIDMATHNYFSHSSRNGASPFTRMIGSGVTYRVAGENLGYDAGAGRGTMLRRIEVAMLHSPEHRANLLRASFSQVGIGVAAVAGRLYVTEDFTG